MMELNAKSPFLWDLENLVMFNTKDGETPKTLQLVESEIEGIEAFELGSFYSSGGVSDGGTGSDLGYASSSRSSKSGSDYSSTDKEIKETKFSLETNDCFQQDFRRKREFVQSKLATTSPTIESSAVSGESLTALELCNRTYFEDTRACKTSVPADFSAKKSKSSSLSLEVPRCQVEGCNVDLSSAKDYHRKHRVCETHSKSPRVVINGYERRFCQQCSRFHSISEFDHKKRSCRRRLSDHNARRRKPKPEIIQFNSMRMASSLYEGRNQLNFGFDQAPMLQTRAGTWDNARNSKHTLPKSGVNTCVNGGSNGMLYAHDGLQNLVKKASRVSNHFNPSKGTQPEIYHRGFTASVAPPDMNTAQNLGALSLLSTSSWGSGEPNPTPLDHPIIMHSNNPTVPAMHSVPPGGQPISSDFWTPSFQLFKSPNDSSFYLY